MLLSRKPSLGSFFLVSLCVLVTLSEAASGQVRDDGKFFSTEAVRQAERQIAQIRAEHGKTLLVQTYPGVPSEMANRFQALGKQQFFLDWAKREAQANQVDGAIVLISRDPSYLQVQATGKLNDQRFTAEDGNELRNGLVKTFQAREFDEGLLRAVAFMGNVLDARPAPAGAANAAPGAAAPTPAPAQSQESAEARSSQPRRDGGGISLWTIIFWALLIFIVLRIIRRLGTRRQQQPGGYGQPGYGQPGYSQRGYDPNAGYGGYGQPGGAGGFGRGALGGLFGGMAGGWLYDRMFRRDHGAGGGELGGGTPQQDQGLLNEDPNQGFASAGGDWGGDAGADQSGGDTGGGDF